MSGTEELTKNLNDLSIQKENDDSVKSTKPKATFDKVALRERWKILGRDAEQSKTKRQTQDPLTNYLL